jgi:hypothetical protein
MHLDKPNTLELTIVLNRLCKVLNPDFQLDDAEAIVSEDFLRDSHGEIKHRKSV